MASFINSVKESTAFLTNCSKTEKKMSFLFTFLITRKYLSLQCFLFGHGAQNSFYSHFSLRLKRKECLHVLKLRWDKTQEAEKIKYFGDLWALKPDNFWKKNQKWNFLVQEPKDIATSCYDPFINSRIRAMRDEWKLEPLLRLQVKLLTITRQSQAALAQPRIRV